MKLNKKESTVIRLRYGIGTEERMTYEQIAKVIDMSSTMVQQFEHRAMRKLRHPANRQALMEIKETFGLISILEPII